MSNKKKNSLHVSLADGRNDQERIGTMTGITKMAPQSALYTGNPAIKAAVDAASQITSDLKTQNEVVTEIGKQLIDAKQTLTNTREKYGKAIVVVRSSVASVATSLDQLTALGITGQVGVTAPAPLTPPTGVKVELGTTHGQFRASAVCLGHSKFGAQVSADPIGAATWTELPGAGKVRIVTGHPSGALVWVRFRTLKGRNASDWCTPVPVTVP